MPLPITHLKEKLSYSYAHTVISTAGAGIFGPIGFEYGNDLFVQQINEIDGKYFGTGFGFHCQLKATTTITEQNNYVLYDMDVEAYNKLINWKGVPIILVVMKLPVDQNDWVNIDENQLLLKNCCYWAHITGDSSTNTSSVRVRIPKNQVFTPETVIYLLDQIQNSEGVLIL